MVGLWGANVKERLRAKLAKRQGEVVGQGSSSSDEEAERLVQEHLIVLEEHRDSQDIAVLLPLYERMSRCLEGKPQYTEQVTHV
jgi:hypothetical protein